MSRGKNYLVVHRSHRRLRRIRFRENWSASMTFLVVLLLVAAFFLVPWLKRQYP